MDLIGTKWSDIALILKDISEKDRPDNKVLDVASKKAYELWEMETEFYTTVVEKIEAN